MNEYLRYMYVHRSDELYIRTYTNAHTHTHTHGTDVMTTEQQAWFVGFYRELSQYSPKGSNHLHTPSSLSLIPPSTTDKGAEAECKRLCAYNFPVSHQYPVPT